MPTDEVTNRIINTIIAIRDDDSKKKEISEGIASNAALSIICVAVRCIELNMMPFVNLIEKILKCGVKLYHDIETAYILLRYILQGELIEDVILMIIDWCNECPIICTFMYLFLDESKSDSNFSDLVPEWIKMLHKQRKEYGSIDRYPVIAELHSKIVDFLEITLDDDSESDGY